MAEKTVWSIDNPKKWSSDKYPSPRDIILTRSSGTLPPNTAKIKSVSYSFWVSAPHGNAKYNWKITYLAVGASSGGSPYVAAGTLIPMSDADGDGQYHEATLTGTMNFSTTDISKFLTEQITIYASIQHTYKTYSGENIEFDGPVSITVEWEKAGVQVYYGTSSGWKPVTVYYGTSAGWKEAQVAYGTSSGWKP